MFFFCSFREKKKNLYLNFHWEIVTPVNVYEIFQDELILGRKKKNNNQWSFSAIGLLTMIWSHTEKPTKYLLWFLAEEETIEELGFAETAADDGDGAVVRGTVILSPEFKQLSLAGHVLSESFKTRPGSKKNEKVLSIKLHEINTASALNSEFRTWSTPWTARSLPFCPRDSGLG